MKKLLLLVCLAGLLQLRLSAQVSYPYASQQIDLIIEGKTVHMSYMDIAPNDAGASKTILLLHGKNFNGYYWHLLIPYLVENGYRVIIPDQVGWGKSDRPNLHYSFHMLAHNTRLLLEKLGVSQTVLLGHSMGGMLATRFALMYPKMVQKLILENPIGLEDYKNFVPYQTIDSLYVKEKSATYAGYKKYQESYYPSWKSTYEQYVQSQAADLQRPDFDSVAFVNALTYQMIYEQPVCYEFSMVKVPTLLVIGQADRTIVGKNMLSNESKAIHGNYPSLGKATHQKIPGSVLKPMEAVGHIPHVQDTKAFWETIREWL